jgi:hypothetical protein
MCTVEFKGQAKEKRRGYVERKGRRKTPMEMKRKRLSNNRYKMRLA